MSFMGNNCRLSGKPRISIPKEKPHCSLDGTILHFTVTALPYLTLESLCGLLKLVHFVLEVWGSFGQEHEDVGLDFSAEDFRGSLEKTVWHVRKTSGVRTALWCEKKGSKCCEKPHRLPARWTQWPGAAGWPWQRTEALLWSAHHRRYCVPHQTAKET